MPKTKISSDHLIEIRYEPMGAFLNLRGTLADFVRRNGMFRQWEIGENRIDFWNANDRQSDPETGFVSFRNCGYSIHNPATNNYFYDRVGKFLTVLAEFEGFKYPEILRLGVRSRFYVGVDVSFKTLVNSYSEKCLNPALLGTFGLKTEDLGITLNLGEAATKLRVTIGPMNSEQFVKSISPKAKDEDLEDVGIFIDLDYFIPGLDDSSVNNLIANVKRLHQKCWERKAAVESYLRAV